MGGGMTLILSGTNGLSDVDGSAATPAIRGTDANTGMFFPAADTIAFAEGGVEAMRLDSAGNVGIGTSSPSGKLTVAGGIVPNILSSSAGGITVSMSAVDPFGGGYLGTVSNHPQLFYTNNIERARIDTSGNLLVGATISGDSPPRAFINGGGTNPALRVSANTSTTSVYAGVFRHESTTSGAYIQFITDNSVETGRIFDSAGTMQYASSSDARLKTNVQPLQKGLSSVLAMNPCTYDMRRGEATTISSAGLIAQEVYETYPYAVGVGGEDENTNPWSVDYGKLTPLLIKAIQEQQIMIEQLKADVAALKGAV
jgi:hypothetical protein